MVAYHTSIHQTIHLSFRESLHMYACANLQPLLAHAWCSCQGRFMSDGPYHQSSFITHSGQLLNDDDAEREDSLLDYVYQTLLTNSISNYLKQKKALTHQTSYAKQLRLHRTYAGCIFYNETGVNYYSVERSTTE